MGSILHKSFIQMTTKLNYQRRGSIVEGKYMLLLLLCFRCETLSLIGSKDPTI